MIVGYDFEIAGGDRARAEAELEETEGVEVSFVPGAVSVALGDEETLRRAWRCLEILAAAGYAIHDCQRGVPVDLEWDFDDVLQSYEALGRLPTR